MKYNFLEPVMEEIKKEAKRIQENEKNETYNHEYLVTVETLLKHIYNSHFHEFDKLKLVDGGVNLADGKILVTLKNAYDNVIEIVINSNELTLFDKNGSIYIKITLHKGYFKEMYDLKISFLCDDDVVCLNKKYDSFSSNSTKYNYRVVVYNNVASEGINEKGYPFDEDLCPDNEMSNNFVVTHANRVALVDVNLLDYWGTLAIQERNRLNDCIKELLNRKR